MKNPALRMTWLPAALALAVLGASSNAASGQAEKVFGEVTEDQALLYIIWPNKSKIKLPIYLDDRLLWQTKGNSYGFAHVDPGVHWIWVSRAPLRVDLVPGQTYYLLVLSGWSLIGSEEGQQYLENVKRYVPPPTPKEIASKSDYAKTSFPKFLAEQHERGRLEIAEVAPPAKPVETEGLVRVPRYAELQLELMQSVTTAKNSTGDSVWFRVAEDADVDGQVWLPAGTPVEGTLVLAEMARRGGVGGHLEMVIPAVIVGNGMEVPLAINLVSSGRPRSTKGAAAFGALGLAFAAKKGSEGYEVAGTRWPAWTRDEIWVRPSAESVKTAGSLAPSEEICQARAIPHAAPLIALESRKWPAIKGSPHRVNPTTIEILIGLEDEIRSLELVSVDDWKLTDRPAAVSFVAHEEGRVAIFDGWDLLQYLRPEESAQLSLEGVLEDGTSLTCDVSLRVSVYDTGKK